MKRVLFCRLTRALFPGSYKCKWVAKDTAPWWCLSLHVVTFWNAVTIWVLWYFSCILLKNKHYYTVTAIAWRYTEPVLAMHDLQQPRGVDPGHKYDHQHCGDGSWVAHVKKKKTSVGLPEILSRGCSSQGRKSWKVNSPTHVDQTFYSTTGTTLQAP